MSVSINPSVEARPVAGRRDLDRFIRVPWSLYTRDANWVPPLLFERRQHFSDHNPYFKHARWQTWVAYRGERPVGRISAQVDDLHLERYGDRTGFFGLIEAAEDQAVFTSLFQAAEAWLRQQGMSRVVGPFNLSVNQECGLLVEGFDTPPSVMMGRALPYYQTAIEAEGYVPVKDLLAYRIAPDFPAPSVMKALVPEDLIQVAELDGQAVAFIAALPNLNEAIRGLNGRLLPFGWARLLWRLKVRHPHTARVALMGVRHKYQRTRLGPGLAFLVIDAVRQGLIRRGVREVELSWVLEDNAGMRNIIETIGGVVYKRYRMFEKQLPGVSTESLEPRFGS